MKQSTVGRLNGRWVIVGDLHGSIHDLIRILALNQLPPHTNYVFLGDYVDRGEYSIEVISLLFSLLVTFPEHIFLIRGNHEFRNINRIYGFYQEITKRYDESMWEYFNSTFDYLPVAVVLNEDTLLVHGGLGPHVHSVQKIEKIQRPVSEVTPILSDLVWSDPTMSTKMYTSNPRGSGTWFGFVALRKFLMGEKLETLVRAHQLISQGVAYFDEGKCITVFSASNYGGSRNYSGILIYGPDEPMIEATYSPYYIIKRDECVFMKYPDTDEKNVRQVTKQVLEKIKIRVRTTYKSESSAANHLPLLSDRKHPSKANFVVCSRI